MPKIIFNYNLCDMAPECGGIEVCPNGAIYYEEKQQRPVWDESKCTFCLKCTTPDACPVGVILFARDEEDEKRIMNMIKDDPRTAKWLWKERYGVQPARTSPIATIVTDTNFESVLSEPGFKVIDLWSEETLDCRLHSPLYEDLLGRLLDKVKVYKLDAGEFGGLAEKLGVSEFPTLLIFEGNEEVFRFGGYISKEKISSVIKDLKKALSK